MKPLYTCISLVFFASMAVGQGTSPGNAAMELCEPALRPQGYIHPSMLEEQTRGGDEPIFYEDFANGLAGNNGVGAWTVSGEHGNIWKRAVAGPMGSYVGNATQSRIQSATVANGYMLFNSDSANSTWSGNNPTPLPPAEFTNWDGSLESPVLDLSATPFVQLQYQQRLRFCCSQAPQVVEVSTDGGLSWSDPIGDASDGAHMNELTATKVIKINLTSAIADAANNVKFRFRHASEANSPLYHWQIDDVRLVVQPEYDVKLDYGLISNVSNGNEYGRILSSQIQNNTLHIGGGYNNFGRETLTNLELEVNVMGPGNAQVLLETISHGALAFEEELHVNVPATVPDLAPGLYNVDFKVRADQELDGAPLFDNNTVPTRRFMVSETVYSLDNIGNYPPNQEFTTSVGSNSFPNNADGLILMTQYNILEPVTVTGLEVRLQTGQNGTQAGGNIHAALRDSADVFVNLGDNFIPELSFPVAQSAFVQVTPQNVSSGLIILPFAAPTELPPGNYVAGIELFGGLPDQRIRVMDDMSVPQPGWSSLIYLPSATTSGGTGNRIWTNGNAFAIRLLTDPTVSIQEFSSVTGTSITPNPTNGPTRLDYSLEAGTSVTVDIHDITGKQVMSFQEGNRSAGEHQLRFDASILQEGAYIYVVRAGERESAGRFVVVK
jgi:hypothetical protein